MFNFMIWKLREGIDFDLDQFLYARVLLIVYCVYTVGDFTGLISLREKNIKKEKIIDTRKKSSRK